MQPTAAAIKQSNGEPSATRSRNPQSSRRPTPGARRIAISAGLSGATLDEVLTASRSVLARLSPGDGNAPPQDVLPGITAAGRIKELADAITTYGGKAKAQGEKHNEAEKLLEAIKTNVPKLAKLRRQVQLAADQAWPWRTPGVATIRKAFLLSPDRPMED
jgi:hypothetical protein